jgi:type IV pilus assembly protein PilO
MRQEFKIQRAAILISVSALIVADVALAVYSGNRASRQNAQQELATLQRNISLVKADITRARQIQQEMPAVQKDCDQFERSLFASSSGYSSVNAELSQIAAKSGLRLGGRGFGRSTVKGHNLTEVHIQTSVSGNYRAIVHFLNGLQRSSNMYAIESLSAHSDQNQGAAGLLQVSLNIKTYFRED